MAADKRQNRRAPSYLGFLVAVLSVALASLIRWRLDPLLGNDFAFLTVFGGVALTVWYGGWLRALFAAGAGLLVSGWRFIAARHRSGCASPASLGARAGNS